MGRTKTNGRPATKPAPWSASVKRFDSYLETEGRPEKTRGSYRGDLAAFEQWHGRTIGKLRDVDQVTARVLRQWRDEQQQAGEVAFTTVNRRLSGLTSFLKWAYYQAVIPRLIDPPKRIRGPKGKPRWLDRARRNDLLDATEHAPGRDRAIILLLLNSGLRVFELSALTWCDVALQERKGRLTVRKGKGGKVRYVPINADCREALMALGWEGHRGTDRHVVVGERLGRLGVRGIQGVAEKYGKAAGLDDFTAHKLRHTFAHDLVGAGVPLERVAAILGHSSLDTTRLYVEPSDDEMQDDVDRISSRDEPRARRRRVGG